MDDVWRERLSSPSFSIAAVTYRNLPQTKEFVDSIYSTVSNPNELEFVVVDNGSPEDLSSYLQGQSRLHPNFKVLRNDSNLGIGPAMNQAMRACTTRYIFRADSDVVLQSPGWDQQMISYVERFPEVGAVGTYITGGKYIPRNGASLEMIMNGNQKNLMIHENEGYIETDLCLSNFMLIPRRTVDCVAEKARQELPRVRNKVSEIIHQGVSKWDGYFRQLGGLLNEMEFHAGWWSPEFPYGTDDLHASMWIRYSGLRITKCPKVQIVHKDDSLRKEWSKERDRRVNIGFQQWRASWEILEDFFDITQLDYDCWPMAKRYISEQRKVMSELLDSQTMFEFFGVK